MLSTPLGIVKACKLSQEYIPWSPIVLIVFGIEIDFRLEHPSKAPELICFTPSCIVTDVKPVQYENADSMISNEPGIIIEVKPVQLLKALALMVVTVLGVVISVKAVQP